MQSICRKSIHIRRANEEGHTRPSLGRGIGRDFGYPWEGKPATSVGGPEAHDDPIPQGSQSITQEARYSGKPRSALRPCSWPQIAVPSSASPNFPGAWCAPHPILSPPRTLPVRGDRQCPLGVRTSLSCALFLDETAGSRRKSDDGHVDRERFAPFDVATSEGAENIDRPGNVRVEGMVTGHRNCVAM